MCELWSVDIHPAAVLGGGLFIDHATGVVVGETAVIGNNCSFLHGITLGSSGKDTGDRHPKLGNDVLIGCGAAILGNITIGSNTKIGAGSIVLRHIPSNVTAVGNPARIVGHNQCDSAGGNMDLAMKNVKYLNEMNAEKTAVDSDLSGVDKAVESLDGTVTLCPESVFKQVDTQNRGKINLNEVGTATGLRFGLAPPSPCIDILFKDADRDGDGYLSYSEYQDFNLQIITFTARNPSSEGVMQIWEDMVKNSHSVCIYLIARARLDTDSHCASNDDSNIEERVQALKEDQILRKKSRSGDHLDQLMAEEEEKDKDGISDGALGSSLFTFSQR
jgi:hypothetical protein